MNVPFITQSVSTLSVTDQSNTASMGPKRRSTSKDQATAKRLTPENTLPPISSTLALGFISSNLNIIKALHRVLAAITPHWRLIRPGTPVFNQLTAITQSSFSLICELEILTYTVGFDSCAFAGCTTPTAEVCIPCGCRICSLHDTTGVSRCCPICSGYVFFTHPGAVYGGPNSLENYWPHWWGHFPSPPNTVAPAALQFAQPVQFSTQPLPSPEGQAFPSPVAAIPLPPGPPPGPPPCPNLGWPNRLDSCTCIYPPAPPATPAPSKPVAKVTPATSTCATAKDTDNSNPQQE